MPGEMHLSDGVAELYPRERNAVLSIKHQLMSELAYRPDSLTFTTDMMKRRFEEQARERCAEIGLVAQVQWSWDDPETGDFSPTVADDPNDNNLYWIPRLQIVDRITPMTEVDHDRMKFEVRSGEADGQVGVIREDGSRREDPRSKPIY
jgi:hypothetical protein